jgi:maltose alpha-D-glucosyltransferase/alpha-amylase
MSLAVLQGFVPDQGDAWQYTQNSLESYFQYVFAQPSMQKPSLSQKNLLLLLKEIPLFARKAVGSYLLSSQLLGERTAELHLALASVPGEPDFAPEPFTFVYQMSLYQSMRGQAVRTLQLLREKLPALPEEVKGIARKVGDLEQAIIERYRLVQEKPVSAVRTRCHGDYHLGQVLWTGNDFVIIDFEGEPARPLSERRRKRSPLKDVAGMIRSFDYAVRRAVLRQASLAPRLENKIVLLRNWGEYWYRWVAATFLKAYLNKIKGTRLVPEDPEPLKILLDAFLLEKAIYEVGYELNNRPDWLDIPLQGVLQLMEVDS